MISTQMSSTRACPRNFSSERSDKAGAEITARVCADENLHFLFYRDLASAAADGVQVLLQEVGAAAIYLVMLWPVVRLISRPTGENIASSAHLGYGSWQTRSAHAAIPSTSFWRGTWPAANAATLSTHSDGAVEPGADVAVVYAYAITRTRSADRPSAA